MPNFKSHALAGAACGAAVYTLHYLDESKQYPLTRFDWGQLLICTGAGLAAGILPDVLEPATSPNHRLFFHSIAFASAAAYLALGYKWSEIPLSLRLFSWACLAGYASHLFLDAQTPKCLPILGINWQFISYFVKS